MANEMKYAVLSDRAYRSGGPAALSAILDLASDRVLAITAASAPLLPAGSSDLCECIDLADYIVDHWVNDAALDADITDGSLSRVALRLDRLPAEIAWDFVIHRLPRLGYWSDSALQQIVLVAGEASVNGLANHLAAAAAEYLAPDEAAAIAYANGMSRKTVYRGLAYRVGGGGIITRLMERCFNMAVRLRRAIRRT